MKRHFLTMRRSHQAGQAAVESAIALPVSLFVVLGLLQMGMVEQARLLADYAAFRGARAASVARCECGPIAQAELAALVPTLGRADNIAHWTTTWTGIKDNKRGMLPIVRNQVTIENKQTPFDKQLDPGISPEKVRLKLRYYYRMNIPFVNWMIARYFLAQLGLYNLTGVNAIHPTSQEGPVQQLQSGNAAADFAFAKAYFDQGIYVAPIYASWSMRMFSQADIDSGSTRLCP